MAGPDTNTPKPRAALSDSGRAFQSRSPSGPGSTEGGTPPAATNVANATAVREVAAVYGSSRRRMLRSVPAPRAGKSDDPCILVVDDDPPILELIQLILASGGYSCLAARSGVEALMLFRPRPTRVALVITDLNMPGLDGAALVHALREIKPGLPCIGTSGSDTGFDDYLWRGERIVHVEKPFTTRELLGAVARLFPHAA
jgi:CheY-like chemotaxis protein